MGGDNLGRLSPGENLALGMMSGVCCKMTNYPLLVWKNQSQQGLALTTNPKLLYRGLPMACLNLGGTTAVQFWFTGFFQKLLTEGGKKPLTSQNEMLAAFLAGACAGVPCSLLELTMIQQQRFGGSMFSVPQRLVADQGARSLTRGMLPCTGRESLFTMAMLGLCPVIQRELKDTYGLSNDTALAAGALSASLFSATLSHPMDTIKTCLQGDVEQVKYTNVRSTAQSLVEEYGVAKGLFKGLTWRVGLITTTFFLINRFKEVIAPVAFPVKEEKASA
jgi:solute carrier family 25 carnitine/acylcarnitine transporter 20/29